MRELTEEEEQWLKIFAKESEFFASLLEFYERNDYLTDKQYNYLARDITKAEEEGDVVLNLEELEFLIKNAEIDEELTDILEIYEDNGFLDEYEYRQFIHIKYQSINKEKGKENLEAQKIMKSRITNNNDKRDLKKTIIRIPCPHW